MNAPFAINPTIARNQRNRRIVAASRNEEAFWLVLASLIVVAALFLVYFAKSHLAAEAAAKSTVPPVVNLNSLKSEADLLPYLADFTIPAEQSFIARRIYREFHSRRAANVSAIARLRVTAEELRDHPDLASLAERLADQTERQAGENEKRRSQVSSLGGWISGWRESLFPAPVKNPSIALLSSRQYNNLKPWFVVRDIAGFRLHLLLWSAAFLAAFYVVHLYWRYRAFAGDNLILPVIHLLSGLGLALMVSLKDPLRDFMTFGDFASGVVIGTLLMGALALIDYDRVASGFSFVFLAGSVLLGLALAIFGSGPAGSRAKVNLFFFQPVEIIRVLLVFFLAGYFASHWEVLRDLRQKGAVLRGVTSRFHVPRLDYLIPVLAGTLLALGLFLYFDDLGPALVIGSLFIILYAVARNRIVAASIACLLAFAGLTAAHLFRYPPKVENRIEIWLDPWRNTVHNGDQIAQSLWALASGGWQGSGLGMGRPGFVPAGPTDLILAVAGEEFGFAGLACIALLYCLLAARSFRIAANAASPYSFFLVTGLNLIVLLQLVLIAAGVLDLFPLSGVVSPFLSQGKTSMIANLALFGIILSVSAAPSKFEQRIHFGAANRVLCALFGILALGLLTKAAYVQVIAADDIAVRDVEVVYPGGGGLGLDYNPRLKAIAREFPRGDIYDRNGLPLATGQMTLIERHRPAYERLGVPLDRNLSKGQRRYYPMGPEFFYLAENLGANVNRRLRGFDDQRKQVRLGEAGETTSVLSYNYSELLPLLRHRYDPDTPEVRELTERQRDVTLPIDSALQLRASAIMRQYLAKARQKGALVALDAGTGELLAAVSYPWPAAAQFKAYRDYPNHQPPEDLIDRARSGKYPPGSSFKLVTAIAALRLDPGLAAKTHECTSLGNGRVGAYVNRVVRIQDDNQDKVPHGILSMGRAIEVSCNAYFAQLGTYDLGAQPLIDTAAMLGIRVARPNTWAVLKPQLPQASYGQGQVVAQPLQMALVAAAIANRGTIPPRFDDAGLPTSGPVRILPPDLAAKLAGFMRAAVVAGTGRSLAGNKVPMAGKTGTAQIGSRADPQISHAWFVGFAPYGDRVGRKIAFAVIVEHGGYGGTAAAPIAGALIDAARELGLL